MSPQEFVAKWADIKNKVNEMGAAQMHFSDICALVGHPKPYDGDHATEDFRFEKQAAKSEGGKGRADVFYRGKFVWEYKGNHGDLDKAYIQVQRYREALGNPPLLIVCDLENIRIYTNFTNTITERHDIALADLLLPEKRQLLKTCFAHANDIAATFKPTRTQEAVTKATADTFIKVVDQLKAYDSENTPPERFAHFIVRLLFGLFAEDIGLLPKNLFETLVQQQQGDGERLKGVLSGLFQQMRSGGYFGFYLIRHFNGTLFDDEFVPPLPGDVSQLLIDASRQDWSGIEPSIFGTLFERVIDAKKRAQLGAHYTSRDDIMLIVEPVLMQPLKREWEELRRRVRSLLRKDQTDDAHGALQAFADKIAATTVLDPACGSGNFLYVALRQLLALQKQVIVMAEREGLPMIQLTVSPRQLYGIEINPYAHELAQITIWIGYIQWRFENGFPLVSDPILQPLNQIERKDAILAYDADGNPVEPEWPSANVIIGNPPFLGDKRMRSELGDSYVDDLRGIYEEDVAGGCDLVCYWFERSRRLLVENNRLRTGLIATNSIRDGANRKILEAILRVGNIFNAWSNKKWVLDGADVRVSIVAFDSGSEAAIELDGDDVENIHANLTSKFDASKAKPLIQNQSIAFIGTQKTGPFEVTQQQAKLLLDSTRNPTGVENSDVIREWYIATDITGRPRNMFILFFGNMDLEDAGEFVLPFEYAKRVIEPARQNKRPASLTKYWWRLARTRPAMWSAIGDKKQYIATPRVAKHRFFKIVDASIVPDSRLAVIARDDHYFFGCLHSKVHEVWSLATSPRHGVGNDPTYNAISCFETFPFPWPPGEELGEVEDANVAAIAEAARELVTFRQAWLHPPAEEIGITISERTLKKRTLTNMYNALVHYRATRAAGQLNDLAFKTEWAKTVKSDFTIPQAETLHDIHTDLDHAVLRAYGWPTTLTDEQLLENLLALNLQRAAAQEAANGS